MAPPKPKKTLASKLSEEFRRYSKHSTMHGLYYLYKCTSRAVKSVWLTVLCCCAALTCYLSFEIWKQYVIDPTVTVVESTHHPTSEIPYPAVVLCDSNLVYGPNTDEITDILRRRGYDLRSIDLFYETIGDGTSLTQEQYHRMFIIHHLLMDLGMHRLALLDMLMKPCDVLLVKCVWRSNEHNCTEMFRKVLTFRGYCCRFDIDYFRAHAANDTNFMSYPDRTKAMELVINGKRIYSNGTAAVDGTAELYVLDPADRLTVMDSPVSLVVGTYFDVSIDLSAVDASNDVEALPRDVRRCMRPGDSETGSSFYSGCVTDALVHEVAKRCKCVPYFWSISGDLEGYSNCHWDRIKCVLESRQSFSGSPAELQSFQTCFQKCDYVKYDVQVQSFELNRIPPDTNQYTYDATYSELSIHFADRTCIKYRREVLFTWDQMLANIGGIFGLCMGGSIISIIELIWLLIHLVYVCITDKILRKNSSHEKKKITENIFVVSKGKLEKVSWNEKYAPKKIKSGKVFAFTH